MIPAGVELRLREDVSDDVAAELVAKEARALLAKNHGDLLIWGRVHSFGEKTSIELRFVSGTLDGAKRPRFMLTETILLEPKFLAQTGSALAAIVAVAARPLTDDRGRYPAKKLIPIATKLHSLVQNLPEAMDSKSRAQIQNAFGAIKATIGYRSNDAAALKEAVVAYREALKEWRRAGELLNCATTQNNLGNALLTLGEQEPGTARLQEAVAAYREALKERTRERVPLDWAETQTSLGVALAALGERESGTTRFQEAIAVHREALKEWTRERVPLDWAKAQNNLGAALTALGEREQSTARLEEAVTTFREALKEWTRERVPLDWATTQSNLGNALDALPGTTRTEEALAAYREALKERTRERVPLDWASTQVSLGAALGTLGESEPGTTRLEEAVAAIRQALKERTRERVPLDWAHTQYGLGMVLCMLGVRLGGDDGVARLQEAESAFEGAREVLRKTNTEFYVDMTKEILDEAIAGTKVLLESLQLGTV